MRNQLDVEEENRMGKMVKSDLKTQKIHQNLTSEKHEKSQVNGQTEQTLHNRLLRTEAKARQF